MGMMWGMSRRGILAGAASGGAAVTLAACGTASGTGPNAPKPAAGPVTLTYAFYASEPEFVIWKGLCEQFTKQSGRITVTPYQTNADGDHFQRMRTLVAAGSESEVMMWKTLELPGDALKDTFLQLDSFVKQSKTYKKDDIFPLEWNKNFFRGKLFALGLTHSPGVIFYNKDMFQKAGVPEPPHKWDDPKWTWDALLDTSRKLSKVAPNPSDSQFGFDNSDSWWFAQPYWWSYGGDLLSSDHTKVQVDSKPVVESLQWIANLRLKEKVSPTADDRKLTSGGTNGMFFANKLAMLVAITSTAPVLAAQKEVRWDIAPLPHRTTQAWTRNPQLNITISKANGGKKADDSWAAMEYLAGEPGQKAMAELHRGLPVNKKVAYSESWFTPGAQQDWKVFTDAAEKYDHLEHEIIKFHDMDTMIADAYTKQLLSGQKSATDMVAALKPQLETLIAENTQLTNGK
jgi:multiple sugar transport system substrate-binding protein